MAPRTPPAAVVTVFTARWAPGSLLVVDKLRSQASEGIHVEAVDVDTDFARCEEHRVLSVPTAIVSVNGVEKRRLTGTNVMEGVNEARKAAKKSQSMPRKR